MKILHRVAIVSFAASLAPSLHAGKLDDAGRTTREPKTNTRAVDDDPEDDDTDDDSGDTWSSEADCDEACAEAVALVLLLPWSVPRAVLESERQLARFYDDYPYAHRAGYVALRYEPAPGFVADAASEDVPLPGAQRWAAQAGIEGGANLEGVARARANARLLMPVPIELEASWLGLAERDRGGLDWAQLSGFRLNWRFAEARTVQFRTGVGYQHWFEDGEAQGATPLVEEQRSRPGVDFAYGFDAFVGKPFVLSAEGRVGVLGRALIWQARATLGAMFGPLEWYAGYDELNIGGVSLGGPITGVRAFL